MTNQKQRERSRHSRQAECVRKSMDKKKVDVIEKRKRRRFRRRLLRISVILLIAAFCVFLYMERGSWLSGMNSRVDSIRQNDGILAEGNYPVVVSGKGDYQAQFLDNRLAVLNNSYLYLYSVQGSNVDTRQVAYTKSVLKTCGDYALCFENGGDGFRVDKLSGTVYEKTAEDMIITGAISSDGYVALITESDTYSCSLYVYDANGKKIYTRNCVDRVNDICFQNDNRGCIFVQMDAEDGEVVSRLRNVKFEEKKAIWETPAISTMCIETSVTNDNKICVIGDSMCAYYNEKGQMGSVYTYPGTLSSYDVESGQAAVLIRNDETRDTTLVMFNGSAEVPTTVSVSNTACSVRIDDGMVYVMSNENIISYDFSGKAVATVALERSYDRFLKYGSYLFLLSYDQIDRIDFNQ